MSSAALPPPVLIATPDSLNQLARTLAAAPAAAVDTESNSLHAYRERVCLIQFSTPEADYIVDPIALPDLSPLRPFFASPDQQKVFHAAEYDIVCLRRDYQFEFMNIFDTMSAARALGWPQVGLADVLNLHFEVKLKKEHQRADWRRRPLTRDQLDYARLDTHYLLRLRDKQVEALMASDLWPEALEEFDRLSRVRAAANGSPDPTAFWRVKGARELAPAQAAVLQALYGFRERQADRLDCPPFKVMGETTLMELARRAPRDPEQMQGVPGMTPAQIHRHGQGVLQAVAEGLAAPPQRPPPLERESDEVRDRYDRLRAWRKRRAEVRGVESDVILPRTALLDLARRPPRTHGDLAGIADFGPWRRQAYGDEILTLLAGR